MFMVKYKIYTMLFLVSVEATELNTDHTEGEI